MSLEGTGIKPFGRCAPILLSNHTLDICQPSQVIHYSFWLLSPPGIWGLQQNQEVGGRIGAAPVLGNILFQRPLYPAEVALGTGQGKTRKGQRLESKEATHLILWGLLWK